MKSVISVFLIAFLLFGTIGFIKGREYANRPEFLRDIAFKYVVPIMKKASKNERGAFLLVCRYKDKVLYEFNTESNSLQPSPTAKFHALRDYEDYEDALDYPIDKIMIYALIGGPTAGFSIKSVLSAGSSKKKEKLAAILGGISGYTFGYKLGIGKTPNPTSKKIRVILDNEDEWKNYEPKFMEKIALQIFRIAHLIKDKSESDKYKNIAVFHFNLPKKNPDIGPIDFYMATSDLNEAAKTVFADSQDVPDSTPFWLEWWWVGFVAIIALLGLIGIINWARHTQKQDKKIIESPKILIPKNEDIKKYSKKQ